MGKLNIQNLDPRWRVFIRELEEYGVPIEDVCSLILDKDNLTLTFSDFEIHAENGKLHNLDGPAWTSSKEYGYNNEYYIQGEEYTEEEFNNELRLKKLIDLCEFEGHELWQYFIPTLVKEGISLSLDDLIKVDINPDNSSLELTFKDYKIYAKNGKLHRLGGPAITASKIHNRPERYYVEGKLSSEKDQKEKKKEFLDKIMGLGQGLIEEAKSNSILENLRKDPKWLMFFHFVDSWWHAFDDMLCSINHLDQDIILFKLKIGAGEEHIYTKNGVIHNEAGPACSFILNDGRIERSEYWLNNEHFSSKEEYENFLAEIQNKNSDKEEINQESVKESDSSALTLFGLLCGAAVFSSLISSPKEKVILKEVKTAKR